MNFKSLLISITTMLHIISAYEWNTNDENKIVFNNKIYNIRGINWFGIETDCKCPHGLWIHSMDYYFDLIQTLGFNSIRVPFSEKNILDIDTPLKEECITASPDLKGMTTRQMMHELFGKARYKNISILLDFHTIHGHITESPVDDTFSQEEFINVWNIVLSEYGKYPNLIGIDIKNEPHGMIRWTNWSRFCRFFIYRISKDHPEYKGLFFIEGIEDPNDYSAWGGSFRRMGMYLRNPPMLNRIVFSPHVYGVSVRGEMALNNMDYRMEEWFGFINNVFANPIVIGEIGGYNIETDEYWHNRVKNYLLEKGINDFYYWALNPDSFDTNGILDIYWNDVNWSKIEFCHSLQPNPTIIDFS